MSERITGNTVYQYAQSPFALWCEAHAPEEARDPKTEFQDLLFDRGAEHERRTVQNAHPGLAPVVFDTEEEGFARVLEAMKSGVDVLHGAPLLLPAEGLGGRADLLVREESAPSVFGSYHYRVKEIKLARNLGAEHRLQGAFYNHLLGKIQGHLPRTFTLVNGDGLDVAFDHDEREIEEILHRIRAIRSGEKVSPIYGKGLWPWESYTNEAAIAADDVSLVDGVGPALRGTLVAAGYATVRALAAAREDTLVGIEGVGPARRRRLPVTAGALARRAHARLADVRLPETPCEVFLDLEGTSELLGSDDIDPIDYLIGCLERVDGHEHYEPFVAHTMDGEADMLRAFLDWLAERPTCILFHWHHYEATHLRKMAERHGLTDAWKALIRPRLRDLHKDATAAFAFPTYGTSLKKIAPYVGFQWRHKEVNAMQSIAYYLDYVRNPIQHEEKLQKVLDYNEDDCRATLVVKDWLVANANAPLGEWRTQPPTSGPKLA